MVNNRTSESPGVRANALAELRIVSSPFENATVLILSKTLLRLHPCSSRATSTQPLLASLRRPPANRNSGLKTSFPQPFRPLIYPAVFKFGRRRPIPHQPLL